MSDLKIKVYISTNKVGSECVDVLEIDEEEWNSLTWEEKDEVCREIAFNMIFDYEDHVSALQSQDAEDAETSSVEDLLRDPNHHESGDSERLQFVLDNGAFITWHPPHGCRLERRIGHDLNEILSGSADDYFSFEREAIDHARRVEGEAL